MLKPEDLLPGDKIVSHKTPKKRNLIGRFFKWCLKRHSIRIYGKDCLYPDDDHDRTVTGKLGKKVYCFNFTDPAARQEEVKDWMLKPDYARVYRPQVKTRPTALEMFEACVEYDGMLYDVLDLISIWLRITHFFHGIGRKNLVCSTGSRTLDEKVVFKRCIDPNVKLAETPPCYPAQYPKLYGLLTG